VPRSFGLAPFLIVVIFILFEAINVPNADAFFGSAEVAMWMADRATRWPSARKGGARSSASDAMAQASIGSGVRPRCPRSARVASLSDDN
tara:strand:- start:1251 stop:1520 length:270 start_codon:yes stop_codon:yes gene_type:complete